MAPGCSRCSPKRIQRCSRCKKVFQCGGEVCLQEWNLHQKTCLPLPDVFDHVVQQNACSNWRGVLEWEGRLDELVEKQTDEDKRQHILEIFRRAHLMLPTLGRKENATTLVKSPPRVELLGRALPVERFRDLQRRSSDDEQVHNMRQLSILSSSTKALLSTANGGAAAGGSPRELDLERLEPLVLRYREAAKAETERRHAGGLKKPRGRIASACQDVQCLELLREAASGLKILDPDWGEKELVKAVALELANLQGA
ncbi:hypothetical protein T484DRAFT_1835146 [Baffinella frigidus]|nr:hypothetical protein T484DRAFT_1835146 [Cryptophyta sp. CCMP2293]